MPVHAPPLPAVIDRNYRYADYVPYYTPDQIEDLRGPRGGTITVPPNICTAPDRQFDLDSHGELVEVYSATVRDGSQEQQEHILSAEILTQLWSKLNLPSRCRDIWESEFPELADTE